MNRVLLVFILVISTFSCKNEIKINDEIKIRLKSELENMLNNDQKHRWQIMYGEIDLNTIDSLQQLPDSIRYSILGRMNTDQYGLTKNETDSLWKLQHLIDSLNEQRMSQIIDSFGFPSNEIVETDAGEVMIVHFTNDFKNKYYPLMVDQAKDKKLSPDIVAQMYDRLLMETGKIQVYGTSGEYDPSVGQFLPPKIEDIKTTNELRLQIGLDSLTEYRLIERSHN